MKEKRKNKIIKKEKRKNKIKKEKMKNNFIHATYHLEK